jgi:cytochrome c peroxidase
MRFEERAAKLALAIATGSRASIRIISAALGAPYGNGVRLLDPRRNFFVSFSYTVARREKQVPSHRRVLSCPRSHLELIRRHTEMIGVTRGFWRGVLGYECVLAGMALFGFLLVNTAMPCEGVRASTPQPAISTEAEEFHWDKPDWAPTPVVPAENPMSMAKVQLGRALFYERRLSLDGSLSCGSCHRQARAFSDGQRVHRGVNGELGFRNVMALTNVAYLPSYTWSNPSLTTLEKQMLVPLFGDHPIEMGMAGHEHRLIASLDRVPAYRRAFAAAFPEEQGRISLLNMVRAIAAFERTLLSFDSPYDRYLHGERNAISASARRGEALFFGERLECYHCHGGVDLTDNHMQVGQAYSEVGFHNTGLYNEDGMGAYKPWDHGLRDITGRDEDEGAFRTPALRNVAVSGPYMHDGSISTLEDVVLRHYAVKGRAALGKNGENPLRSDFIAGFTVRPEEVRDLVAFLNSLTDANFLTNPAFADPHSASKPIAPKRATHAAH